MIFTVLFHSNCYSYEVGGGGTGHGELRGVKEHHHHHRRRLNGHYIIIISCTIDHCCLHVLSSVSDSSP
jgi:hypothetical protein